jgi:hypothetical protein
MIDIEKTKKILGKPKMSDEEAEQIRNDIRTLAEIAVDSYLEKEIPPKPKGKLKEYERET